MSQQTDHSGITTSRSSYQARKVGSFKTPCVHRKQLCPFVPHDPIEDVEDDANRHYSDPDAVDDQLIFNGDLPEPDQTTSTELTGDIDFNEPEAVDTEHDLIYYEQEEVHVEPHQPKLIPGLIHDETMYQTEPESHLTE